MNKKVKTIIGIVVVLIIIAVIIFFVSVTVGNKGVTIKDQTTAVEDVTNITFKNGIQNESTKEQENQSENSEDKNDNLNMDDSTVEEITTVKKQSKDPFKNIKVYEETQNKDDVQDQENEEYPGEKDGWSPIVSPDDLEQ